MALVEEHLYKIAMAFNAKVLALRERKQRVASDIQAHLKTLEALDAQWRNCREQIARSLRLCDRFLPFLSLKHDNVVATKGGGC